MPLGQTDLENTHSAGQSHRASVVSMLAHRLRRWPNIWSALPYYYYYQVHLLFITGHVLYTDMYTQGWVHRPIDMCIQFSEWVYCHIAYLHGTAQWIYRQVDIDGPARSGQSVLLRSRARAKHDVT